MSGVCLRRLWRTALSAAAALALLLSDALAQELEPGAYQNAPVGMNVVFAGYGFSKGNILLDAALPVEGANATVHGVALGYLRTLNLFGRSAKLDAQLPISWARFEGVVEGEFRTRSPRGLADPRVRLSVNLLGSPALDPPAFATYRQRTIFGASIQITLPLGQYDRTRVVNLGANRWAFRPELALSHAHGRWVVEVAAGVWLFTDNTDYFDERTLSQKPLLFAKANAICTFRRNLWTSVGYARATGGETRLNGRLRNDLQRTDRIGATLALPLARGSALKFVVTSGLTTRLGADFDSIGIVYQYSWAARRRSAKT